MALTTTTLFKGIASRAYLKASSGLHDLENFILNAMIQEISLRRELHGI